MAPADDAGAPTTDRHHPVAATAPPFAFQGMRAGLVTRAAANIIDFLLMLVVLGAIYVGVAAIRFLWSPRTFSFPAPPLALAIVLGSVLAGVYFAIAWMTTGRTYGDHVLGLRVVGRSGRRMRPGLAMVRAVLCVVCPIGLLWVTVNRENRSLQDAVLRTKVVYDWSERLP